MRGNCLPKTETHNRSIISHILDNDRTSVREVWHHRLDIPISRSSSRMMTFSATRALFVVSVHVSVCKKEIKYQKTGLSKRQVKMQIWLDQFTAYFFKKNMMLLMCFIGEDDDKVCVCVCLYNTQTIKDQNIQNLIYRDSYLKKKCVSCLKGGCMQNFTFKNAYNVYQHSRRHIQI